MSKVTFTPFNGERQTYDAADGVSVMQVGKDHNVPGIDADCGGECNCATCHVYVDEKWMPKVGMPHDAEEAIMSLNPDRKPNSRLSCQIKMSADLDGLVVNLLEIQY